MSKITILSTMLLIVVSVGTVVQFKTISRLKQERTELIDFSNSRDDSLKVYVNKFGHEVAKTEVLQLSVRNTKQLLENDRLKFLNEFKSLNKRLNNLEQATKTIAEYSREVSIPILGDSDSIEGSSGTRTFSMVDSLNSIHGWIKTDTVLLKFKAVVPIYSVVYWQRKRWAGLRIGKKEWFSEVTSTNPNVTIKKHSNIQIRKK
jgi:hypothetical protein